MYLQQTKKYFLIINDRLQKSFVSTYNLTGLLWPKTSNAVILSKISGAYLFPLPPMVARKAQNRLMKIASFFWIEVRASIILLIKDIYEKNIFINPHSKS